MALTQQGQQRARVSGHLDWPEMPKVFVSVTDAQKQEALEGWYAQLKLAVMTKLDTLANEIEALKEA